LDFDLFGRALADQEIMLSLDVVDNHLIHGITRHSNRVRVDDSGHRDHSHVGGASSDVYDHVADWFGNRKSGTDGGHDWLLYQVDLTRLGTGLLHGAAHLPDASPNPLYVTARYGPDTDGNIYVPIPPVSQDSMPNDLPEGSKPSDHPELLAGTVGLFGLRRASVKDDKHGGAGLSDALHLNKALDVDSLPVTIVPHQAIPERAEITVGRIGIYRQGH
jgi:hypothetical protein